MVLQPRRFVSVYCCGMRMRRSLGVAAVSGCVWAVAGALAVGQGPVLHTKPAAKDDADAKSGADAKGGAAAASVIFPVVLRDRKGAPVAGLNASSFTLQVDSKPA